MKNFGKNIEDATDEELLLWVNTLDFRVVHLASDELTRRWIKRLNESIDKGATQAKEFTGAFRESSKVTERFTAALFLLALVQLLVALFQLVLSFAYSDNVQAKILGICMSLASLVILIYFANKIFKEK